MRDQKWLTPEQHDHGIARRIKLNEGTLPDAPFAHYLSALRTELAAINSGEVDFIYPQFFQGIEDSIRLLGFYEKYRVPSSDQLGQGLLEM